MAASPKPPCFALSAISERARRSGPGPAAGLRQNAVAREGSLRRGAIGRLDDRADRDPVLRRELVIAHVMRGDGHQRARSVLHQDEVRAQMGIFSPLNGLIAWRPVKTPSFSTVAVKRSASRRARSSATNRATSASRPPARAKPMSRGCSGARTSAVAPNTVSHAGREDLDRFGLSLDGEAQAAALASADPVALHRDDPLGPPRHRFERSSEPRPRRP